MGSSKCITAGVLAGRLKGIMAQSGKTQAEFAHMLGISQPMLSQILNGMRLPSEAVLEWMKWRHVDHYEAAAK